MLTSGLHDTTSSFFVLKFLTWPFLVTFLLDGENVTLSSQFFVTSMWVIIKRSRIEEAGRYFFQGLVPL